MTYLTLKQVQKKYKGIYIEVSKQFTSTEDNN
jgi:hypothetical protein